MNIVTTTESGITNSEMPASSGLIQNIMPSTPMMVSTAVITCVADCWRVCAMLSMSLVTRDRVSPRALSSKYLRGSRASFSSTCLRRP